MRFAKWTYRISGILGLLQIVPAYFIEAKFAREYPPAITHPEFYYGFMGVTLAWQVVFLVIASDPLRFRPLMPVSWIEKSLFPLAIGLLYAQGRTGSEWFPSAALDVVWLVLFVAAWFKTRVPEYCYLMAG